MFANQLETAIEKAPLQSLDEVAKAIWKALYTGQVEEQAAERLTMALEARRTALKAMKGHNRPEPSKQRPRAISPAQRNASIVRRRRYAASGSMPPEIAGKFTTGEQATLAVIAMEIRRKGVCKLVMDKIAALAGVSRTTARNAIRQAQRLGLLVLQERRIRWWRNLSNIITLVSADWRRWLRLPRSGGGCKKPISTNTSNTTKTVDHGDNETFQRKMYPLCSQKTDKACYNKAVEPGASREGKSGKQLFT